MSAAQPLPGAQAPAARVRYELLNTLRGVCILSMVAYHACYDLANIKGLSMPWFHTRGAYWWQQSICWGFILLSGLCWHFSRNPLKRGLIVFAAGGLISLVTVLAMPGEAVWFGVLSLIGSAMLLMVPLEKLLRKIPAGWGLAVSLLLFFLLRNVPRGTLGFEGLILSPLPDWLYVTDWLAPLGFHTSAFVSSDYFALIPWLFLYLAGYFLWRVLERSPRVLAALRRGVPPLSFLGKHSLLIYLLHQPLLMGIFMLV